MTDRDRLEKLYEKAVAEYGKTNKSLFKKSFVCDYLIANGVIVQQQGKWETTQEPLGWKDIECVECSNCHENWICDEENDFEFYEEFWKYCPNCGARMVKGV